MTRARARRPFAFRVNWITYAAINFVNDRIGADHVLREQTVASVKSPISYEALCSWKLVVKLFLNGKISLKFLLNS